LKKTKGSKEYNAKITSSFLRSKSMTPFKNGAMGMRGGGSIYDERNINND